MAQCRICAGKTFFLTVDVNGICKWCHSDQGIIAFYSFVYIYWNILKYLVILAPAAPVASKEQVDTWKEATTAWGKVLYAIKRIAEEVIQAKREGRSLSDQSPWVDALKARDNAMRVTPRNLEDNLFVMGMSMTAHFLAAAADAVDAVDVARAMDKMGEKVILMETRDEILRAMPEMTGACAALLKRRGALSAALETMNKLELASEFAIGEAERKYARDRRN